MSKDPRYGMKVRLCHNKYTTGNAMARVTLEKLESEFGKVDQG